MKRLEVDFPETGLPEGMELVGVEYKKPKIGDRYWSGNIWCCSNIDYELSSYHVAILKPKEVWLPCTPEDAFAKMLNPKSRVIRLTGNKAILITVSGVHVDALDCSLRDPKTEWLWDNCRYFYDSLEVLKTKEIS